MSGVDLITDPLTGARTLNRSHLLKAAARRSAYYDRLKREFNISHTPKTPSRLAVSRTVYDTSTEMGSSDAASSSPVPISATPSGPTLLASLAQDAIAESDSENDEFVDSVENIDVSAIASSLKVVKSVAEESSAPATATSAADSTLSREALTISALATSQGVVEEEIQVEILEAVPAGQTSADVSIEESDSAAEVFVEALSPTTAPLTISLESDQVDISDMLPEQINQWERQLRRQEGFWSQSAVNTPAATPQQRTQTSTPGSTALRLALSLISPIRRSPVTQREILPEPTSPTKGSASSPLRKAIAGILLPTKMPVESMTAVSRDSSEEPDFADEDVSAHNVESGSEEDAVVDKLFETANDSDNADIQSLEFNSEDKTELPVNETSVAEDSDCKPVEIETEPNVCDTDATAFLGIKGSLSEACEESVEMDIDEENEVDAETCKAAEQAETIVVALAADNASDEVSVELIDAEEEASTNAAADNASDEVSVELIDAKGEASFNAAADGEAVNDSSHEDFHECRPAANISELQDSEQSEGQTPEEAGDIGDSTFDRQQESSEHTAVADDAVSEDAVNEIATVSHQSPARSDVSSGDVDYTSVLPWNISLDKWAESNKRKSVVLEDSAPISTESAREVVEEEARPKKKTRTTRTSVTIADEQDHQQQPTLPSKPQRKKQPATPARSSRRRTESSSSIPVVSARADAAPRATRGRAGRRAPDTPKPVNSGANAIAIASAPLARLTATNSRLNNGYENNVIPQYQRIDANRPDSPPLEKRRRRLYESPLARDRSISFAGKVSVAGGVKGGKKADKKELARPAKGIMKVISYLIFKVEVQN